ncbi:MAG: DUF1853 family protein [Sneathiella sp.]|nr:DUF1853 family protein [Sneathiella sp.]
MVADPTQPPFALRDLQWVISSPFLLKTHSEPDLSNHPETRALIARLEKDPAPLMNHLTALPRQSLGRYFEQLVIFWLENLPSVNVIRANLRVYREKRSLGEIDLLFTQGGQSYHWELAVKFYLNIGTEGFEKDYVGPMQRDNLGRKLDRLYDHQLRLANTEEARELLERLGVTTLVSSPWVKGRLFHPLGLEDGLTQVLPDRVSRKSLNGRWISIKNLAKARLPDFDHFLFPDKSRWLTPSYFKPEAVQGGKAELITKAIEIRDREPVPQLACLMTDAGDGALQETMRLFITPEDWPGPSPETGQR